MSVKFDTSKKEKIRLGMKFGVTLTIRGDRARQSEFQPAVRQTPNRLNRLRAEIFFAFLFKLGNLAKIVAREDKTYGFFD